MTEDKIIAVREIKITMSFMLPAAFQLEAAEYVPKINNWIKAILKDFNGQLPSSEMAPLTVFVKSEDVTD